GASRSWWEACSSSSPGSGSGARERSANLPGRLHGTERRGGRSAIEEADDEVAPHASPDGGAGGHPSLLGARPQHADAADELEDEPEADGYERRHLGEAREEAQGEEHADAPL